MAEPGTEEMRARFVSAQQREAELLDQRFVAVNRSRHDIHMQQPHLAAEEIVALVATYREQVA